MNLGVGPAMTVLIEYFAGLSDAQPGFITIARCDHPADPSELLRRYRDHVDRYGLLRLDLRSVDREAGAGTISVDVENGDQVVPTSVTLVAEGGSGLCIESIDTGGVDLPLW